MAYKAKERDDLLAGIDEFLDQVTVLPPGEWDPSIRIEPPKNVPSQVTYAYKLFVAAVLSTDKQKLCLFMPNIPRLVPVWELLNVRLGIKD